MYATFSFSYSELACAIPKAGGVFDYAKRAWGKDFAFIAGMAQNIEFVFGHAAIAFAIGAYFHEFFPAVPISTIGVIAYIGFTALNIYGVRAAAIFELTITILAVGELLLFAGITLPHFKMENLTHHPFPNGWAGVFAAVPFAVWIFLGIEGVANVAEETKNPQRDISIGFGSAIFTLVILCIITLTACVGVGGWEAIMYEKGMETDKPLPLAMGMIVGKGTLLYHMLITVGLFGLIASFHGLILAAGRSTFEFGRSRFAPRFLGHISPKFHTPGNALAFNMVIGIGALLSGKTTEIITLSAFGALSLYIIAMISLFALRNNEPELERPFKVPMYPLFPMLALLIAVFSIIVMTYYNLKLALIYFGILIGTYILFKIAQQQKQIP
jgi:ethanolamine permease